MTDGAASSADVVDEIFDESNPDPQRWRALMVIAIAQLMVVLDASIVNLALPSAKRDLGISDANQQWVITAYTLTFGGLLLLGGRIADYVGRKRTFMIGLVGFAAVSALGAVAPNQTWLFVCRALQGAFAALLAPSALSLMTVTFHAPKERARAFGVFGAISGGGAAIGLLLGGFLTEYLSWRWCLLVNTPIAVVALLLAVPFVRESKTAGNTKYDIPGAVTATLGLVTLVYAFTKAAPAGRGDGSHWGSATTISLFVVAVILLLSFVIIELRTANPLLPMRILLDRNRGGAYLVSLILGVAIFAMFLFLGLYLQVILGYSPVTAGFAFLPFTIGIIFGSAIFSQLLPRVGPRPIMVPGLLGGAAALVWLAQLTPTSTYAAHILPPMLLLSVSMAAVFIPMTSAALHAIKSDDAGVASAVLNTTQQVGASLGTALLNTVAATVTASYLAAHLDAGPSAIPGAVVDGYTRAFLVGAGMMVLGALVAAFLMNIGKEAASENDLPVQIA